MMSSADAAVSAPPHDATSMTERLELLGLFTLFGVAASVQLSIAVAQSLFAITVICWVAVVAAGHERFAVPRFFWLLLVYAGATLVSAALSPEPTVSLVDTKQLLLFLIVPVTYRFVSGT